MKVIVHGYLPGCEAGTPDAGTIGVGACEVRAGGVGSISGPLCPQPSSRKAEITMMPKIKLERMISCPREMNKPDYKG